MPVYHFNVHDGVSMPDEDGHALPGIVEAKRVAVTFAAELIREHAPLFWQGEEWKLEVTDDTGLILFTLTLVGMDAPAVGGKDAGHMPVGTLS